MEKLLTVNFLDIKVYHKLQILAVNSNKGMYLDDFP